MDFINSLIPEYYWEAIGWTLVHSTWQIMAVSLLLWLILRLQSRWTAHIRYLFGVTALGLIVITSIWTFHLVLDRPTAATAKHAEKMLVTTEFKQAELVPPAEMTSPSTSDQTPLLDYSLLRQNIEKYIPSLVNLWLLGALFYLFRLAGSLLNLRHLQRKHHTQVAAPLLQKVDSLIASMGFFRKVTVLKSHLIHVPVTFGIFKPIILLPASLLLHTTPAQLEAIIAHELAHIKRFDYLINILQSFLEVIFFYHPCFWWINELVRSEREHACDDLVLSINISPHALAKGLAEVAEQSRSGVPEMALAATGSQPTLNRIKRILGLKTEKEKLSPLFTLTMVASLLISLALFSGAVPSSSAKSHSEKLLVTKLKSKTIVGHWNLPCQEEVEVAITQVDTLPQPMAPAAPPSPPKTPQLELTPLPPMDLDLPHLAIPENLSSPPKFAFPPLDLTIEGDTMQMIISEMIELRDIDSPEADDRREELKKSLKQIEEKMEQKTKIFEQKMEEWEQKHEKEFQSWEAEMKVWEEKMQAQGAAWEAQMAPRIKEFELKMKAWETENAPRIKEFEEKMKLWEREIQKSTDQVRTP